MKFTHIRQPRIVEQGHDQTINFLQRASNVANVSLILVAAGFWLLIGFTVAYAAVPAEIRLDGAAALVLQGRYDALRDQLASSSFNRPVALESSLNANDVKGDIYAVVPSSFEKVSAALSGPQGWCEILILHLNTKYCGIAHDQQGTALLMNVGKKFDQPLADSYRLHFGWRLADQNAAFLRVVLSAETGPLSTRDYRITLEAVPLANGTTFLHLSYAYGFGLSGKIAMLAYFATTGRNKVGFSVTGTGPDGQPVYIDGMRGLVERNTMRYYLAIESFLGSLATSADAQFEKRINDWFTAIEHYPRQLHEMEQTEYLDMKRKEYRRQQLGEGAGNPGQG
jgi:hypothetical protein